MGLLECPLKCGQCFPNSRTLKKHLESHLTNVKCPYCFLLIDNIHSLPSHLDDCIINKKEDEPEDETEQPAEGDLEYDTEVISVLPDDDNFNAAIIKEETETQNDKPDPVMVFNINPADELLDKESTEVDQLKTSQEKIDDTALSDETESETETQEIEGQEDESAHEDVNIKFEDITDDTEQAEEYHETSQEYDMGPVVEEAGEQEIEAEIDDLKTEKDENVYHCSSCNAHFTDVKQHLAEFHTNQQVYLQVPEKEGKKVFVKQGGTSEPEYEEEMDLENLPSSANDNKDQAIWVSWSGDFYLSTRNLLTSGFESSEDLSYVIRPKKKNACVDDLSPFYMEDQYGDKFFSVPVDTAIDYYEASNGRCGPKRFVGNFTRVFIGKVYKPKSKQRHNVYECIISTYQLSLT
uniref:C2H2-type domain-containing protein n=1 Tax=Cacopsylla melanoneura TaxID=428564 RepID=A0A8D9AGC0_9HEMI